MVDLSESYYIECELFLTDDMAEKKDIESNTVGKSAVPGVSPTPRKSITGSIVLKVEHATTYLDTLIHLFKGNIGPGVFAMGSAFKNGGIVLGPILTVIIAIICVHCQHLLIFASKKMQQTNNLTKLPDFADTISLCFKSGPEKLRKGADHMRIVVNIFICVTQFGFCCIYFVFIENNFRQIIDHYGWEVHNAVVLVIIFIPVLIPSLLLNLKHLMPVSLIASICMISGILVTMYGAFEGGLPNISDRHYSTNSMKLALYFGTAMFAFEGIALVLPLKTQMKKTKNFESTFGVLNIGMIFVTFLFCFAGFFGYLKWGEDVAGSLTLNLDIHTWYGQFSKIVVSIGVLLGYPLQFFIAIKIMYPKISKLCRLQKIPKIGEVIFRFIMVGVTFVIANVVPRLDIFISLIGALCSTALALVFPPIIEIVARSDNLKGPGGWIVGKNIIILIIALIGFAAGSYESGMQLINALKSSKTPYTL